MQVPSIHNNSTDKQELFYGYHTAMIAVETAIEAIQDAAPHPRDYYVQEAGSFRSALHEHMERLNKLYQIKGELSLIIIAIQP
jgi:hypothetical protein